MVSSGYSFYVNFTIAQKDTQGNIFAWMIKRTSWRQIWYLTLPRPLPPTPACSWAKENGFSTPTSVSGTIISGTRNGTRSLPSPVPSPPFDGRRRLDWYDAAGRVFVLLSTKKTFKSCLEIWTKERKNIIGSHSKPLSGNLESFFIFVQCTRVTSTKFVWQLSLCELTDGSFWMKTSKGRWEGSWERAPSVCKVIVCTTASKVDWQGGYILKLKCFHYFTTASKAVW